MKGLQTLDVNNCNLNGTLPGAWAKNLPALQQINASANALTGAHCVMITPVQLISQPQKLS